MFLRVGTGSWDDGIDEGAEERSVLPVLCDLVRQAVHMRYSG